MPSPQRPPGLLERATLTGPPLLMTTDRQRLVDRALTTLGRAGDGLHSMRLLQHTPHKLTLLAERAGQRFVLRIDLPDGAVPGLSRPAELAVLRWAAAAGLGPTVAASAPGVLLLHYLDGRSWTADDLRDPQRLARAGRLLRRLHDESSAGLVVPARTALPAAGAASATNPAISSAAAGAASAANLPPLQRPDGESPPRKLLAPPSLPSCPPGVSLAQLIQAYADHINTPEAHATAARILELLPEPPAGALTLCHRDPTAPNLLETAVGELRLLDWEYAGPGDPLYDLAVIIEHHALDAAATATLLHAWAGDGLPAGLPAPVAQERLGRAREAYRLVVQLWQAAADPARPQERQIRDLIRAPWSDHRE
jgi:thiamine kinase-like enzyme